MPDYERFGLKSLSDDMYECIYLRNEHHDIAAITAKTLKVKFNGTLVPTKTFSTICEYVYWEKK